MQRSSKIRMDAMVGTLIEDSDAELAALARDGDRDAFARLVARHYDFMFRLAWRSCGRREEAEDLAQDVCVRLAGAIRSYRGGSAFTTWLYAVVLNTARDHLRRRGRDERRRLEYAAEASGEMADTSHDPAEALWEAVRRLPDKQREAVTLVYGEGLVHAAAADAMGVSESTVSWHIHEARKRLKAHFASAGDD